MSSSVDVVVIGAGLSGLSAAYTIVKENSSANVVVLEATDNIGGPILSQTLRGANGEDVWDVGAGRIGTKQKEIMGLIQEFGLETYPHYNDGKKFWILTDGKIKKYSGNIPPLPYTSLVDMLRYFNKVDGLQGKVNVKDATATAKAEEWDNMTVEELKTKTLWTKGKKIKNLVIFLPFKQKGTIDIMTGLFFGGFRCDQLSVMQYLHLIATCGSWNSHIAAEGTGKIDVRIKIDFSIAIILSATILTLAQGGTRKLVDGLVSHIGQDKIITGSKVNSIEHQSNSAVVTTEAGKAYTAKCVIVACIPSANINFNPPLSIPRVLPGSGFGVQFVITYKKSFWREAGSCAEVMNTQGTMEMLQGKDDHPIVTLFDHTSPNDNPALMGIFGANLAMDKSMEERKQIALKFLKEIFETDETQNFLDYKDIAWKPYDRYPPIESLKETKPSEILSNMLKPEGVVHWAGARTGLAWADCLNGAVEAGQRSAKEVLKTHLN
ncbi:putative flavin-containing monoamine oxidase A [Apostichopus japonicus]|uniref:Amine oxidase n=1 Tax=Stichopus japonicus TaxID=307972 RepID=A0A2G8LAI7_STIJA|nr:putative flavin-containing monoamine oxidase A [Apostichopus japonicus]